MNSDTFLFFTEIGINHTHKWTKIIKYMNILCNMEMKIKRMHWDREWGPYDNSPPHSSRQLDHEKEKDYGRSRCKLLWNALRCLIQNTNVHLRETANRGVTWAVGHMCLEMRQWSWGKNLLSPNTDSRHSLRILRFPWVRRLRIKGPSLCLKSLQNLWVKR